MRNLLTCLACLAYPVISQMNINQQTRKENESMKLHRGKVTDAAEQRIEADTARGEREYRQAVLDEGPEHVPIDQDPPGYAAFVEKLAIECSCVGIDRPCDGLLAGGLCDNLNLSEHN